MKLPPKETVQAIPFSNSTVCRRIDEMAGDIEGQLICLLKCRSFSLQLDETTLQDSEALLMAYVMFFNAKELVEEMLFARRIRTDTKGSTIFEEIRGYFEENGIPMENIIACATDGAASMVGRYRGFISYLKAVIPSVFTIHCVVHREHLLSKKLAFRLNHSLSLIIQDVNFIKSHALQNRLFGQLCEENGEDFDTLLLHTEAIAGILKDEDLLAYVPHLKQVTEDMKERFYDLLNLDIPSWIFDPFGVPAVEVHPEIQEELIELQSDVIARHTFGQFGRGFWIKQDLPNKFPTLWGKQSRFLNEVQKQNGCRS
uniref:DUF4371 domain-containing protein n=1 Tax=Trichuris muris TaxID=70415 RepID=A0A5S6R5W3_TRIMR